MGSVSTKSSPSEQTDLDENCIKSDVEIVERSVAEKWWSAEEIGSAGEKANTGRSRFSVVSPPIETHQSKVIEAPRPPSIFTTKTSIYGADGERNGEPEVIRPSSSHVKTWSRHISTQFLDWGRPVTRMQEANEAVKSPTEAVFNKRSSKAIVTNLDWQEF